jgi:integrase
VLEAFFERIDEFDSADPLLRKSAEVSANQVNVVKKMTKSLFRGAHEQGYIMANPAESLRLESVETKEHALYTPEQFGLLLEYVNPYYQPHLLTLYWSSMRVGELGALAWDDIRLRPDGKVDIRIEHGLSLKSIGRTKTPKSRRLLTMPAFVASAIREHQIRQAQTHAPHPSNLVFTTSAGGTLDTGRFRERVLYKALERANKALAVQGLESLPKVTVHGLRHSTITVYSDMGSSLPEAAIRQHAGHTNQQTTNLYTHLDDQRREAMAELMEAAHAKAEFESGGESDSESA